MNENPCFAFSSPQWFSSVLLAPVAYRFRLAPYSLFPLALSCRFKPLWPPSSGYRLLHGLFNIQRTAYRYSDQLVYDVVECVRLLFRGCHSPRHKFQYNFVSGCLSYACHMSLHSLVVVHMVIYLRRGYTTLASGLTSFKKIQSFPFVSPLLTSIFSAVAVTSYSTHWHHKPNTHSIRLHGILHKYNAWRISKRIEQLGLLSLSFFDVSAFGFLFTVSFNIYIQCWSSTELPSCKLSSVIKT